MPKQRHIYSFDVFDTCLLRLCGEPRNLFDVLSKKVMDLMRLDAEEEQVRKMFVALRYETNGMDLYEIYSKIGKIIQLPCSVEEMVRLEMQTEAEMLRPIETTRLLVERLRLKGDIMFISDMYLPDDFIREQLMKYGLFHEGDRLYVSNTVGAWKCDGSLYKLIHERENITYHRWHHYGDNRQSDQIIPKKLGIDAHWLHYDYLPYERQWIYNMQTMGYQYPSILAGVSRATRLVSSVPQFQSSFVADISAPIMTAWVYDVLQDAQRRDIRRIYFQARDTHSYLKIARKLQPLFPDIELRYLFISRRSLYCDDPLRIKYFEQEGLATVDRIAIVDISSSGHTRRAIDKLLLENNYPPIAMSYCFFGLWKADMMTPGVDDKDLLMAENKKVRYFAFDRYIKATGNGLLNRLTNPVVFIEDIFSLNFHGRTLGYRQQGNYIRPVFGPDTETPWNFRDHDERKMKRSNDALLSCFVDAVQATGLLDYYQQIMERIAMPTLANFINRPDRVYLDYLQRFQYGGVNYVDKRWKKNVWKRGSTVYSLSPSILNFLLFFKKGWKKLECQK